MFHNILTRLQRVSVIALILLLPVACTQPVPPMVRTETAATIRESPQVLFNELFVAVQSAGLYPDSKTFADAVPKAAPAQIMARYEQERPASPQALKHFVETSFILPIEASPPHASSQHVDIAAHIDALWGRLTRNTRVASANGSLLPLPRPYVVPGGRFREMYYWDSYFTMLGLVESGRHDLLEDMVRNFAYLIDTYGHVPNGTRSYYLSRSQPPFFFAMVGLLSSADSASAYARYLPQLRREYTFWMQGEQGLAPGTAQRRVVAMTDGAVLNRYWDDSDLPRDESYSEDVKLAHRTRREASQLFRDIRAAAESGWDFSSRWFADGQSLATIHTTQIVPIDLNSLLFGLERAILAGCKRSRDMACTAEFDARVAKRHAAIDRYLWDETAGVYRDYDWTRREQVPRISAATLYPLFVEMASPKQAEAVSNTTARDLLKAGGIVTTPLDTSQQWDAPNGWAPLQWIAVSGLRHYGSTRLAATIACRWMLSVKRVYNASGKMMEKYDVMDIDRLGGGGEYPLQDGFGWTNGVMRKLMVLYPEYAGHTASEQCPTVIHPQSQAFDTASDTHE